MNKLSAITLIITVFNSIAIAYLISTQKNNESLNKNINESYENTQVEELSRHTSKLSQTEHLKVTEGLDDSEETNSIKKNKKKKSINIVAKDPVDDIPVDDIPPEVIDPETQEEDLDEEEKQDVDNFKRLSSCEEKIDYFEKRIGSSRTLQNERKVRRAVSKCWEKLGQDYIPTHRREQSANAEIEEQKIIAQPLKGTLPKSENIPGQK